MDVDQLVPAVIVVTLVLTVGCVGAPSTTTEHRSTPTLPPGVSQEGLENRSKLAATHHDRLVRAGNWTITERVYRYEDGRKIPRFRFTWKYDLGGNQYRWIRRFDPKPNGSRGADFAFSTVVRRYRNETGTFLKEVRNGSRPQYGTSRFESNLTSEPREATRENWIETGIPGRGGIQFRLTYAGRTHHDGKPVFVYNGTAVLKDGERRSQRSMWLTPAGIVIRIRTVVFVRADHGWTRTRSHVVRIERIGNTTAGAPTWVATPADG